VTVRAAAAAALGLMLAATQPVAADGLPGRYADVCLEIAPSAVSAGEWSALAEPVAEAVEARTALFPSPAIGGEGTRLDISSGHFRERRGFESCLEPGFEWTTRFDFRFLDAGADQMLAEAPTTPGIDSTVNVQWEAGEPSVSTALYFAGPLDIPNGWCWVEERLSVDAGAVAVEAEQGVETSPFAEGACGRFFDHLPEGGAGEQAVTLLPTTIELPDGGRLRFVAEEVSVRHDALVVAGSLARD
jgi:hypothetical protein